VEIPLPKVAEAGAKSLRLIPDQQGFSIGLAILTSRRQRPPSDAELKELERARLDLYPPGGIGEVVVTRTSPATSVDLSREGTFDWIHWGTRVPTDIDRKKEAALLLPSFVAIGTQPVNGYSNNLVGYSWSDGAPTPAIQDSKSAVTVMGKENGFSLSVPAASESRVLRIYLGVWQARARLEAKLSGSPTPSHADTVENAQSTTNLVFTFRFRAGTPHEKLLVKWTVEQAYSAQGNVTFQAATLSDR
jgi:hypothetical protein